MATLTLETVTDEVFRALKMRAISHNLTPELEAVAILESALFPADRLRLGTALSDISRRAGLQNADIEELEAALTR